jgi:PKD repeat protein
VDASSSATTTADYNDIYPGAYSWNGTSYASEAAFHTATGQGQHDIDSQAGVTLAENSPMINSANSSAPGELSTDYNNNARVVDPVVPETGAGTYAYYDRGAAQFQDPVTLTQSSFTASATKAPVGGSVTLTASAKDTWNDVLTYEFVPGAGGGVVPPAPVASSTGTATLSFDTATQYSLSAVAVVKGTSERNMIDVSLWVNVVAAAPLAPALSVTAEGATSVSANAAASTDSWNVTGYSFDFGDGTLAVSSATDNATHTYAKPGTYTVTVTEVDAGGNTGTKSSSITTNAEPAGTMVQLTRSPGGFWGTAPFTVPPGSTGIAQAAVTGMPDGSTQVAAVTTNGVLELDILSANGTWQGWKTLSQPGVTVRSASIAGMPNGSSQIVEVTSAGMLKHNVRNADGTWQASGWGTPAGSTGIAQAAITALPNGSSQLVAVTTSGSVLHNIRFVTGAWQGWRALSQPGVTVRSASIAGMPNGSSQIVEVTSAGVLKHNVRNADGTWQASGWGTPAGSTGIAQAAITALPNGSAVLGAITSSGGVESDQRNPNGSWQSWNGFNPTYLPDVVSTDVAGLPNGSVQLIAVAGK